MTAKIVAFVIGAVVLCGCVTGLPQAAESKPVAASTNLEPVQAPTKDVVAVAESKPEVKQTQSSEVVAPALAISQGTLTCPVPTTFKSSLHNFVSSTGTVPADTASACDSVHYGTLNSKLTLAADKAFPLAALSPKGKFSYRTSMSLTVTLQINSFNTAQSVLLAGWATVAASATSLTTNPSSYVKFVVSPGSNGQVSAAFGSDSGTFTTSQPAWTGAIELNKQYIIEISAKYASGTKHQGQIKLSQGGSVVATSAFNFDITLGSSFVGYFGVIPTAAFADNESVQMSVASVACSGSNGC